MAQRFDSLLPVSVKAELNVNQGSDREKHECKQIELRASQVRGNGVSWRKERVGGADFLPALRLHAPRAIRSKATSNIHGNGLTIYHSFLQILLSLFKVSSLSLSKTHPPPPSHFFPAPSQQLVSQTMQYLLNKRRSLNLATRCKGGGLHFFFSFL